MFKMYDISPPMKLSFSKKWFLTKRNILSFTIQFDSFKWVSWVGYPESLKVSKQTASVIIC